MDQHIENHMVVERSTYRSSVELEELAENRRYYVSRERERITAEVDGYSFDDCMDWTDDLDTLESRVCATPEGKAAWGLMMSHYRAMVVEGKVSHLEDD